MKFLKFFYVFWTQEDDLQRPLAKSEGWWVTGDHGSIDERGFVHLVGRQVELITSLGDRVLHPERIENALEKMSSRSSTTSSSSVTASPTSPPSSRSTPTSWYALSFSLSLTEKQNLILNGCRGAQARLGKEKGVAAKALYKAPYINEITVAIQKHVIAVNRRLPRGFPTLKRFTVLRKQFSLDKGTTPSLLPPPNPQSSLTE